MLVLAVLGLALIALALIIQRGPGDVQRVAVDRSLAVGRYLEGSDYSDSYRTVLPEASIGEDFLDQIAFQKGKLIESGPEEIVYRSSAPGLTFHVSYATRPSGPGSLAVHVSTVVHYVDWKGRVYFSLVRPIHRAGLPWMTRRVTRSASADVD